MSSDPHSIAEPARRPSPSQTTGDPFNPRNDPQSSDSELKDTTVQPADNQPLSSPTPGPVPSPGPQTSRPAFQNNRTQPADRQPISPPPVGPIPLPRPQTPGYGFQNNGFGHRDSYGSQVRSPHIGQPSSASVHHQGRQYRTMEPVTPDMHPSIYVDHDGSYEVVSLRYPYTLAERLRPTIDEATEARDKFAKMEFMYTWLHNGAIGLQVLLGSLTTGLSAVAATGGKSSAAQTTILGGLSTVVASYLANARGSNEPDLSKTRVKDLNQFLRDCDAFIKDHGHLRKDPADIDDPLNQQLVTKRKRLEEILGNINRPDAISGKPQTTNQNSNQNGTQTQQKPEVSSPSSISNEKR